MREILFRGKRVDNGEWVYGFYFERKDTAGKIIESIIIVDAYEQITSGQRYIRSNIGGECSRVDPATVGQYTGLTDKCGTKIFEGDVVDASETWLASCGPAGHSSPVIPVKWACDICGFDPFADYDRDCGVYIYGNEVEVIGNIHDNPELLEEVQ